MLLRCGIGLARGNRAADNGTRGEAADQGAGATSAAMIVVAMMVVIVLHGVD